MTTLSFDIRASGNAIPKWTQPPLDLSLDDYRSILAEFCEAMAGHILFGVSGFGQTEWPVTVETDLPVFLEQIPNAVANSKASRAFEIDFYEQGLERRLDFRPSGSSFEVECTSGTEWRPTPETLLIERFALKGMLDRAMQQFLDILERSAPETVRHPWIVAWKQGALSG